MKNVQMMGPAESDIRGSVHEGDRLNTPAQSEPFWVAKISGEGSALERGKKRISFRAPSSACVRRSWDQMWVVANSMVVPLPYGQESQESQGATR